MNRIDELRETWEKDYKVLVNDLGNQLTFEDVACMFFELGWCAADESMIEKVCEWLDNINTDTYMDSGIFQMSELIQDLKRIMETKL